MNTKASIHIVGAGIAGLTAALYLEKHGFTSTLWEASDAIGGRLRSEELEGFTLDVGFQVLLEAYPKAKEYLDYSQLKLQSFLPGAEINYNGKKQLIGDPFRDVSFFLPTLTSSVGTISDKLKIFQLNQYLKHKKIEKIFSDKEQTTLEYLKAYGFSERIIERFFMPFFGGIFLEPELETSSRMFEFVYKMFGEGTASIPQNGIYEIPKQLMNALNSTKINRNTEVSKVERGKLFLQNGKTVDADYVIIATAPGAFVQNLKKQQLEWHTCENLYFKIPKGRKIQRVIGLVPEKELLINNFHYLFWEADPEFDVISVTVIKKHELTSKDLRERIASELQKVCGLGSVHFLKQYTIKRALPILRNLQYDIQPSESQLTDTIFLAGDYMLNGSLNAAMQSGERAASGIIRKLQGVYD